VNAAEICTLATIAFASTSGNAKKRNCGNRERFAHHCPVHHINLSLLCGEQKRHNPPHEALENRTGRRRQADLVVTIYKPI
jgi:hypothetical protein